MSLYITIRILNWQHFLTQWWTFVVSSPLKNLAINSLTFRVPPHILQQWRHLNITTATTPRIYTFDATTCDVQNRYDMIDMIHHESTLLVMIRLHDNQRNTAVGRSEHVSLSRNLLRPQSVLSRVMLSHYMMTYILFIRWSCHTATTTVVATRNCILIEWRSHCICWESMLFKLFVSLVVRSLCDVVTTPAETVQSRRDECWMCLMDRWWGRCYWEIQRERRMHGRWSDETEDA